MQEKKQNISPIKQKILLFINYLGISKREFYEKTGISRGTIDNTAGITEDTLTKLFVAYSDINKNWLFGDSDEMIADNNYRVKSNENLKGENKMELHEPHSTYNNEALIETLHKTIEILNNQLIEANKDKEIYRLLLESKLTK